jgi:hypothetical protein
MRWLGQTHNQSTRALHEEAPVSLDYQKAGHVHLRRKREIGKVTIAFESPTPAKAAFDDIFNC